MLLCSQVLPVYAAVMPAEQQLPDDLSIAMAHARAFHYASIGATEYAIREWQAILSADPSNEEAQRLLQQAMYEAQQHLFGQREQESARLGVIASTLRRLEMARLMSDEPLEPGPRFDHSTTVGTYKYRGAQHSDTTFNGKWGYYGSERIHWTGSTPPGDGSVASRLTAEWDYFRRNTEDVRLRQVTYSAAAGPWHYVVGDTSSKLSRYVAPGVTYRGLNARLEGEEADLQVFYGASPFYRTDKEEYIHPRRLLGARGAKKIGEHHEVGVSLSYLDDSSRIEQVGGTNPKENMVVALDQSHEIIPGLWSIDSELALSTADLDTSSQTDELSGTAGYVDSTMTWDRVGWRTHYERVGHGFRSLLGLSQVSGSLNPVISDRQDLGTEVEFRPTDDSRYSVEYSQYRSNLDGRPQIDTLREHRYGARGWWFLADPWPAMSAQLLWRDRLSVPGNDFQSSRRSGLDSRLEFGKTVDIASLYRDVDLRAAYSYREALDAITNPFHEFTEHRLEFRGGLPLSERIRFDSLWAVARLYDDQPDGDVERVADQWLVNFSVASQLWDTASLTLGYEPMAHEPSELGSRLAALGDAQTYEATFRWPWLHELRHGGKVSFSPYMSFYYQDFKDNALLDRTLLSSRLEAAYESINDHRLGFDVEYRDMRSNDDALAGSKEFRMLLVYRGWWGG